MKAGGAITLSKVLDLARLLREGHAVEVAHVLRERFLSSTTSLGLVRDLRQPFAAPSAKIPLDVRPLRPDDDLSAFRPDAPGISGHAAFQRLGVLRLIGTGLQTCYVGVTREGRVCYTQWLAAAPDNDRIQEVFHGVFPRLEPNEALLEGAYTPDEFRGLGIMSCAMARIAEHGRAIGAERVITFVEIHNVGSLKGCKNAGFAPYLKRELACRLFLRSINYERLPENTPFPFEVQ